MATAPRPVTVDRSSSAIAFGTKFCLSGISSMCAESATFPVDMAKTRLQLQGEGGLVAGRPMGFLGMIMHISRTEGLRGLYAGLSPAVARHIPYTGCRTVTYEHLRTVFCGEDPSKASFFAKAACGMSAGALAQSIAVPCDLVKVRMMGDARLVAAGQMERPRYTGLLDAFRHIYKAEGFRGMYTGCSPAIQRAALVNLGELTTYDTAKSHLVGILGDGLCCHVCSAVCSGFFASLCSTPADVAKSRIMNQTRGRDGSLMYSGTLDCWFKTVRGEGFLALYKGFVPGWMRLGPWQLVFWCSYEQLRIVSGLGGFK
eukprot:TRINITY_DN43416_c0_g1_i1.p1 TRINITY_DN43416_c0_g1~~TRINITY_DN43416_c0_g1_i1.p1  ORF type:complete len:315 (+),score=28.84 TRINITY_DN43416_c0_g1_i1:132-1076(+)